jgi:multidrug efflux pump subunit AcrB
MGVTTADLAETLRASFYGQEVQRLQRGRHEVKLMVRYPKVERENLATLDSIRVRGNDGVERPIVELAEVNIQRGYQSINRIDQKRAITVSGDVRPGGNATELLNNTRGWLPAARSASNKARVLSKFDRMPKSKSASHSPDTAEAK